MFDWLEAVMKEAQKSGEWEIGDSDVYVLNDAVVVLSMEEGRKLEVKVVSGKPNFLDITTNLVEEK